MSYQMHFKNSSIKIFWLSLWVSTIAVFVSCQTANKAEVTCLENIPALFVDTVVLKNDMFYCHMTDTFSVVDWYFYDEVIYYLYSKGCIKSPEASELFYFEVQHDSRESQLVLSELSLRKEAQMRRHSPKYYSFFAKNVYSLEFRSDMLLLSFIYGKLRAANPQEGVMYNAPFLPFLLRLSLSLDQGNTSVATLDTLHQLLDEVRDFPSIYDDLRLFRE